MTIFDNESDFILVPSALAAPFTPFVTTLTEELVTGPGVPGFELLGLDVDNLSFRLSLFGATDTIVLDGVGDAIAAATEPVDVNNDVSEFHTFTADEFDEDDLIELVEDAVAGDDGTYQGTSVSLELTGIDQDNFNLAISGGGATDTVVIDQAEDVIAEVDEGFIDVANASNELGILDASEDTFIFIGDSSAVSEEFETFATHSNGNGPIDPFILGIGEIEGLAEEVILGDGVDGVDVLNVDDDTITLAIGDTHTDILVVDNIDLSTLADAAIV